MHCLSSCNSVKKQKSTANMIKILKHIFSYAVQCNDIHHQMNIEKNGLFYAPTKHHSY